MEISWFSALCDDDYEYLGVPDPALLSSWEHCRDIALAAEAGPGERFAERFGFERFGLWIAREREIEQARTESRKLGRGKFQRRDLVGPGVDQPGMVQQAGEDE